jgi:curved DNA-binding protein CbpA
MQVAPDAAPEQIKKQYYLLARKYHPGRWKVTQDIVEISPS